MPEIPPELAKELKKLDAALTTSKARYEEASRKRAAAFLEAAETHSTHRIAAAIGKSQSRVTQIVKEARAKAGT